MEKLRTINTTLTFFIDGNKVLLGEKKRGFAKGTFNGIGGKQDPGETIEEAMIRECEEEIGARPTDFEQVGKINFDLWYKGEHAKMEMFVYKCYKFDGKIVETEEIIPSWFDTKELPLDRMLEDDAHWIPDVLNGKKIVGNVKLGKDNQMIFGNFDEVESFNNSEVQKI